MALWYSAKHVGVEEGLLTITPKLKLSEQVLKVLLSSILKFRNRGMRRIGMSTKMMAAPRMHAAVKSS